MEAIAAEGASLTQYKANCRKMANLNREKVVETFKKIEKLKKSGVHPARLQGLKRELEGWKAWQRRWETWFEDADSDWANLGRGK